MMAPPGTPGAATMVMPSMKMNPAKSAKSYSMPCIIINARAQATILSILPERWIVAQSGMINACYETVDTVVIRTTLQGPEKKEKIHKKKTYPYIVIKMPYTEKQIIYE